MAKNIIICIFANKYQDMMREERSEVAPGVGGMPESVPTHQLQFLERDKIISITGSRLPHWHQTGKVQFVTFRLADSLPQCCFPELSAYKEAFHAAHPMPWDPDTKDEYDLETHKIADSWLDRGYGDCLLRRKDVRQMIIDALVFYHGKRYTLHHFVIMPNHVHLLLSPFGDEEVTKLMGSVKRFSAKSINTLLGRTGAVWQRNIFDRIVRNAADFEKYVRYIHQNPRNLPADQYSLGIIPIP